MTHFPDHPDEQGSTVRHRKAVVMADGTPKSRRGTLLVHVAEQDGRLAAGDQILAIPVYVGQPGMEAAIFASTLSFRCTQTIVLGGVMLDLSPNLLANVGRALQEFTAFTEVPAPTADGGTACHPP